MEKRPARAGQVLNAEEHPVLLRRGSGQQRFALALAGFQRHAGVAQFPGQQQRLEIHQRFVNHNRLELGRLVHTVFWMGGQIAVRGLFDVLDAFQGLGRLFAHAAQELQHVIHRFALLVEIHRVEPLLAASLALGLLGHLLHAQHALDVPIQIVSGQLDFQMGQAVPEDPLAQGFGQPVAHRLGYFGLGQRVQGAHQVVKRHAGLGFPQRVAIQVLAAELVVEVAGQILRAVLRSQQVVAVGFQGFALGVEQGGFQRTGHHQLGQPRNRLGQLELLPDLLGGLFVLLA